MKRMAQRPPESSISSRVNVSRVAIKTARATGSPQGDGVNVFDLDRRLIDQDAHR